MAKFSEELEIEISRANPSDLTLIDHETPNLLGKMTGGCIGEADWKVKVLISCSFLEYTYGMKKPRHNNFIVLHWCFGVISS